LDFQEPEDSVPVLDSRQFQDYQLLRSLQVFPLFQQPQ
jgi:hypothetical protein